MSTIYVLYYTIYHALALKNIQWLKGLKTGPATKKFCESVEYKVYLTNRIGEDPEDIGIIFKNHSMGQVLSGNERSSFGVRKGFLTPEKKVKSLSYRIYSGQ